jgi:hypothetical protein
MRTSEDVREPGLYVSQCCNQELIFYVGDTFWRCPECHRLCDWELSLKISLASTPRVRN